VISPEWGTNVNEREDITQMIGKTGRDAVANACNALVARTKRRGNGIAAALAVIAFLAQPTIAADRLEPGLQGQTAPGDAPDAVLATP
jgi:hypothetical protein